MFSPPRSSKRPRVRLLGGLTLLLAAGACASGVVVEDNGQSDGGGGSGNTGNTGNSGGSGGAVGGGTTTGGGGSGGVAPTCGDGHVDSDLGETCDPPDSCPTSCDDQDSCTDDLLTGSAAACTAECTATPITLCAPATDGCCPSGCSGQTDIDCASCGNDIVELGEICDGDCPAPGCDDLDACTTDSGQGDAATCDLVCDNQPITQCVGGDNCCPSGCDANSDSDCGGGRVFLTSSNGTAGFYGYDVATNIWSTLPSPPSTTYSQLTTNGSFVYLLGSNNIIYRFTPSSSTWSVEQTGPGSFASSPIALFKWTSSGFYYVNDGDTTMYRSSGNQWLTMTLPQPASCAGTYDPGSDRLYIRVYFNQSLMIWNTANDTLVQQWTNASSCGENSRSGSYYDGYFYSRDWSAPFSRMDVTNGQVTATAITPSEGHTATDVNPVTGDIFIGPYTPSGTAFQIYNVPNNSLTTVAPLPVAVSNHSTVVFVANPQ